MTDTDLNIAIARARGWARPRDMRDYGSNGPWGRDPNGKYNAIPNYIADPREWGPTLAELLRSGKVRRIGYDPERGEYIVLYPDRDADFAPTLGRAVAEAWWACNDAAEGGR